MEQELVSAEGKPGAGSITWFTTCWLVTIGIVLVACNPSAAPPAPGRIVLEYARMSESDVIFRLVNGSSRTVHLEVTTRYRWPCVRGLVLLG